MNELTETEAKEQGEAPESSKYWQNQIDASLKRERKWRKRADEVVCRYLDERGTQDGALKDDDSARRINILWSNTEVLKSILFSQLGSPDVRRTFPQPGKANKVARVSALVLERSLVACANRYDLEDEIKDAVTDYLLSGRGQLWMEYDAEIVTEQVKQPDGSLKDVEKVGYQQAKLCHVCYNDWTHGPGKKWQQVPWVARLHLFTKDDVKREFPDIDLEKTQIPFNHTLKEGEDRTEEQGCNDFKRAKFWEIWDKISMTRIYVAEGYDWEIERTDDPYKLEEFFPCPKPLFGVKTPDRLIPQPEYCQYQDQAAELDRLNQRIYTLVETLKYCGVYDGSSEDADGTLSTIGSLNDGQFIAYKNMASLAQGKGLAAAFQVRDLAPIAGTIQALAERAVSLIQSIYEITGISDVIRGSTNPSETLGAQKMKAQFGSARMQTREKEVQKFVKFALRIKAEIIAEHFEPQQLSQMTGILLPTEAEKAKAKQLLAFVEMQKKQQEMMAQQAQQQPQMPPPMPNGGPPMQPEQMGPPPGAMPPGMPPMAPQGMPPQMNGMMQ